MNSSVRLLVVAVVSLLAACADPEVPDPARLIAEWRTYYNRDAGIEFRYPYTLALEVETSPDGQLVVELQWLGRQTPVFKLVTREAGIDPPVDAGQGGGMVDGLPASWTEIEGNDGDKEQRVSVISRGREFIFTGAGDSFGKVLETVIFLDERPPAQSDARR
jgi:hypothetical protein